MPWKRQWASRGREWFHADRETGGCQAFGEEDLPSRRGSDILPSTWIADELGDHAVLVANCAARPLLNGQVARPGVHLYKLADESLTLLNVQPIPFIAWTSWVEDGDVMLAGMTLRTQEGECEGHHALGRAALVRCASKRAQWEEVPLGLPGSRDVDLVRDHAPAFGEEWARPESRRLRTEAWIASERMVGGDRVLVAGLGREGIPEFDATDTRSEVPFSGDHQCLAFVSYRAKALLAVERGALFERILHAPDRCLFVVCRGLRYDVGAGYVKVVECLHVMDPLRAGLQFRQMHFRGLSPDCRFVRIDARYYPEVGFLGVLDEGRIQYLIRSGNAIDWDVICDSTSVSVEMAADLVKNR